MRDNIDANDDFVLHGETKVLAALENATISLVRPGAFSADGATEESMAREWVHINQGEWRYDHGIGRWFHWNGARWIQDAQNLAFHLIGEHLRIAGSALGKKALAAKAGVARGVEAFAIANPRIAIGHEAWDADPFLLGTPGGTVNLSTTKIRAASSSDLITRSTTVTPEEGRAERWLQFINEATNGDEDLARFLQQVLGYCLTGSTREQSLFEAIGDGGNGKSVFLNTATRIMGNYATTAAMDTFTASKGDRHPTDLARLDGARFVAASETTEGRAWDEARIKQLTGGDRIAARFMRQDFFEFTPRFKLFIVANNAPVLHNVDDAMRRRFNVIPFLHKPPAPDPELEEKLAREDPQILSWMIAGARDWLENGLQRPAIVTNATHDYFADQDMLGQWLDEHCQRDVDADTLKRSAFESWCRFASLNNHDHGTQNAFSRKMAKRNFAIKHTSGGDKFVGLKLLR